MSRALVAKCPRDARHGHMREEGTDPVLVVCRTCDFKRGVKEWDEGFFAKPRGSANEQERQEARILFMRRAIESFLELEEDTHGTTDLYLELDNAREELATYIVSRMV